MDANYFTLQQAQQHDYSRTVLVTINRALKMVWTFASTVLLCNVNLVQVNYSELGLITLWQYCGADVQIVTAKPHYFTNYK